MKKLVIVGAVVGLILGIMQLFYVRTVITKYGEKINSSATCTALTAECGFCPEGAPIANGLCYSKGKIQRYRGLPFNPKSGFNENKSTKIALLYTNVAIFIVGVPILLVLLTAPLRHRRAARLVVRDNSISNKSSKTASEEPDSDVE